MITLPTPHVVPGDPAASSIAPRATHEAFGLRWALPFPLASFAAARGDAPADVAVELVACLDKAPTSGRVRVDVQAGRFLVSSDRVVIEPVADASADSVGLTVMGTCAALVLHQRQRLPLHASGVLTPRGAVLFTGWSGAGKSTTLAALEQRGYPMICDDMAALHLDGDGRVRVSPGVVTYKLRDDSAGTLAISTHGRPRVAMDDAKVLLTSARAYRGEAPLVHGIYALGRGDDDAVVLEPCRGAERMSLLVNQTWLKLALPKLGLHTAHFARATTIANAVRMTVVRRPIDPALGVRALADRLEQDFSTHD